LNKNYSLSFTAGSLLFKETKDVIEIYLTQLDWIKSYKIVLDENILQYRSQRAVKRVFSEIKQRIAQLTVDDLNYLLASDRETQVGIIWIAICMQYRIIYEFISETVPNKIIMLDNNLSYLDYDRFFELKAEENEALAKTAESTQKKAKSVIFKMLRQVGILNQEQLSPMILPNRLGDFIINKDKKLLRLFPLTSSEIERWINE
jgi:hypothetical protein